MGGGVLAITIRDLGCFDDEARRLEPVANTFGPKVLPMSWVGGEGGIRTHDTLASMPHFECGAFNHSTTSPKPPDLASEA